MLKWYRRLNRSQLKKVIAITVSVIMLLGLIIPAIILLMNMGN